VLILAAGASVAGNVAHGSVSAPDAGVSGRSRPASETQ
jgi:hypothetical protein